MMTWDFGAFEISFRERTEVPASGPYNGNSDEVKLLISPHRQIRFTSPVQQ